MLEQPAESRNHDQESQHGMVNASAPQITLPKGGGAIRGIGEKFAANPVTGTGSLTVPIYTSPGRSGFGPQLSLSYDSGNGNSAFGFGWSLGLPSLARKTDKGLPRYADAEESDIFILSGAEDLVPLLVLENGQWVQDAQSRAVYGEQYSIQRYRPRIEGLFARIERWVNLTDPGDTFWRSISKDNITTWYGKTAESRIADPADPSHVFSWLICESYDDKGNVVAYRYKPEDSQGIDLSQAHEGNRSDVTRSANRYLKHVCYGNRTPYLPDLTAPQPIALPADWCFQLVFDYGEHDQTAPTPQETAMPWACRSDPFSSYHATFEVRTYRLCRRALMFHHFAGEPGVGLNCLVRSTDLTHADAAQPPADPAKPFYSYLLSVTQTGYRRNADGSYLSKALPPLEFAYTDAVIDETVRDVDTESLMNLPYGLDGSRYQWVDLDGEGVAGVLTEQSDAWFYKPNLSPANQHNENGTPSTRVEFGPAQVVARQPSLAALGGGRQRLIDLSGDGQLDLVQFGGPSTGFFERTEDEDWGPFTPFAALPALDWQNPNLTFVDVTGDGHADVLISQDDALWWHESLAQAGFGPGQRVPQALDEEKGPKLIFADPIQSIFLADLSGDGLTDIVRIRNGEVCYWPNLGYGRFGAKVTMDQAPWFEALDLFDGRRIRLADIDGSGTTDLIYFASNGVHLYFNQSGNAWGERHVLQQYPPMESLSSATVVDLLGNGTACLVWSSPLPGNARRPMRYVDLLSGQKPHLLVRVTNNLGTETRIEYAPSTKFYMADKLAGTPWLTRIPFPVHVVERVETYDYVSRNCFVTRYAYHHGYYDGVEREFRGFGKVEQWDTEELAALTGSGTVPQASNLDVASNVPPVLTTTWFHTGAYIGETVVSKHFAQEYYRSGAHPDATLPDDTVLPTAVLLPDGSSLPYELSAEEWREACRALRGSILRQEIYALDGGAASARPYSASERNYTIEVLQPRGPNRYGVFFAHSRETIDFHYERALFKVSGNTLVDPTAPPAGARDAADPRVIHALTLAVDPFGNVEQSVAVGYGRRYLDPSLTPAEQAKQAAMLITYTDNSFTNAVLLEDAYRAPVPAEARTYELLQVRPPAAQPDMTSLFRFDEMQANVQAAGDGQHDVPYEDLTPTGLNPGQSYRRLIERVRTLYRPDDMGASAGSAQALLPMGKLESLALPGASYKLAFTAGLLAQVYRRQSAALLPAPAAVLGSVAADGGGYVDLDGDSHWWIPSGRLYFLSAPGTPPQEQAQARSHFFLPRRFEDPFGNSGNVAYDAHNLLVVGTVDAAGNSVSALYDYRVLQPALVTDPNLNRAAARFDVLGMMVGMAVMGKAAETLGDSLDGFTVDLTDQQIDAFYSANDPHTMAGSLLGNATTRIVYDVDRFAVTRAAWPADPSKWQPAFAATLARETHAGDPLPPQALKIQISFAYSDGFGREIQKKVQAEPGPVVDGGPIVNPRWTATGWTIFNNKGKPVRQYEPFFSQLPAQSHQFEFGVQAGVSPILCYDPDGRVVATLHPNHSWEKVVFDPWKQVSWDVNDTVLIGDPQHDPDVGPYVKRLPDADYLPTWYARRITGALGPAEQDAAQKAAGHAGTPTTALYDTLGRTFLTIAHNRSQSGGSTVEEHYRTLTALDIEGNQRSVTDTLHREAMAYDYNMLGARIHQLGIDAGERWMLADVLGKPLRGWDSREHTLRHTYDALRRQTGLFVQTGAGGDVLAEQTVYGEGQPNDQSLNLRGKAFQSCDGAGIVTNNAYDFKGNLRSSTRQLLQNYKDQVDWSQSPALESEAFTSSTTFDALNRPVTMTTPDGSVVRPAYNEANLLEGVAVNLRGSATATSFVTNIDYNARGQRELIEYGNGARTAYAYDPETFRLVHLTTTRSSDTLQDLGYAYDPAGNVTWIKDAAQQTVYFDNQVVSAGNAYVYDAIYRLTGATGREHIGQLAQPQTTYDDAARLNQPLPTNGQAMRTYAETYTYDAVGSLLALAHMASGGNWTRSYAYDPANNRLKSATVGALAEQYTYDAHGNMTQMPQLQVMEWDVKDQLHLTQQQAANAGTGERTYYAYNAAGQRVRKVTERANGTRKQERGYLGAFELYREYDGTGTTVSLERETLHVMDDQRRIALVETRTQGDDGSPAQLMRYQHSNHLDSAVLELDDQARVISYEEYYPYGSTSYQAVRKDIQVPLKRYRYTGKERDEETGFYYHGARYYAPWLGRWTAVDPKMLLQLRDDSHLSQRTPTDEPLGQDDRANKTPQSTTISAGIGFGHVQPDRDMNSPADRSLLMDGVNPYLFVWDSPLTHTDPDGKAPTPVGTIYVIRGTIDGKAVVYTGSTARELRSRFSKHEWKELINAESTTIEAYTVKAELNVAASGRGTLRSAQQEALRSAEQVVLKRRRAEAGLAELNEVEAATEENIALWAERHNVQLGARFTFKVPAGVGVAAFAGFQLLDIFIMWRDQKLAGYVMAPYLLEDAHGVFTINEQDRGIFRSNKYFKNYKTGPLAGQRVEITSDEFSQLREEAEALWGTTDWKGDWVPGLLRRELPEIIVGADAA